MEARGRLAPVDGLRGLAALMIVIGHVHERAGAPDLGALSAVLTNLGVGVQLFFVLSGFCLFYPLTKPGAAPDWRRFFARRARRILPPYYATLCGVLLLPFLLLPARRLGLIVPGAAGWPDWQQVWPHVLLVYTLSPATIFSLDGPFWSLGVEVQFYLVFPLAVWLVARYNWRGLGVIALLTVLYRCGVYVSAHAQQGVAYLSGGNGSLDVKVDFFLGTWLQFGLGMAVALLVRRRRTLPIGRVAEAAALLPAAGLVVGGIAYNRGSTDGWLLPIGDTLITCGWSVLLGLACVEGTYTGRLFAQRLPVGLGTISYSLYLIHDPILMSLAPTVLARGLGGAGSALLLGAVGVPVVLACAWGWYWLLERPFLQHARGGRAARGRVEEAGAGVGAVPAPAASL